MKQPVCPLCLETDNTVLFISKNQHGRHILDATDTFSVCRCHTCNLVFLSDITVNAQYFRKYYSDNYYRKSTNPILQKLINFSHRQKVSLIRSYVDKKDSIEILDVGCGNGEFLSALDPRIFIRRGVEIHKEGYALCKKKKTRCV